MYCGGEEFVGWEKRLGQQEPVVWQYRCQMDFEEGWLAWCSCSENDYLAYQTPDMFENVTYETRKLYTSPPKREPLSYSRTADLFHANKKATNAVCYWAGVSDAEKAHNIGVDDE